MNALYAEEKQSRKRMVEESFQSLTQFTQLDDYFATSVPSDENEGSEHYEQYGAPSPDHRTELMSQKQAQQMLAYNIQRL